MSPELMKLRIRTSAGDILVDQVKEYVCGKLFFYINVLEGNHLQVKTIKRDVIKDVYRVNDHSEWKINLKNFKEKL